MRWVDKYEERKETLGRLFNADCPTISKCFLFFPKTLLNPETGKLECRWLENAHMKCKIGDNGTRYYIYPVEWMDD